jgi:hypothetical protein
MNCHQHAGDALIEEWHNFVKMSQYRQFSKEWLLIGLLGSDPWEGQDY